MSKKTKNCSTDAVEVMKDAAETIAEKAECCAEKAEGCEEKAACCADKAECCAEKAKCCKKKCCPFCRILKAICLMGIGFLVGVHFRAIKAWIKGEEIPKAPAWHCWTKLFAKKED